MISFVYAFAGPRRDLRLCRFFCLSNGYWLRAQVAHDTEVAAKALAPVLRRIKPWVSTAA